RDSTPGATPSSLLLSLLKLARRGGEGFLRTFSAFSSSLLLFVAVPRGLLLLLAPFPVLSCMVLPPPLPCCRPRPLMVLSGLLPRCCFDRAAATAADVAFAKNSSNISLSLSVAP
ncbi:unnamed protein product, partial [Ectocarpus sp. 12 AP-2014]